LCVCNAGYIQCLTHSHLQNRRRIKWLAPRWREGINIVPL
jgi:hypothetical protein